MLGEVLVEVNGAAVRLRPAERRLVAALAVGRSSALRYEALAEAVWGDRVPSSAKHSLQSHVRRVREAAGDGLVQTVTGGYCLDAGVNVDIDAFESAMERARVRGCPDDDGVARGARLVARRTVRRSR